MEALLHQILAGLATGGIYASLALALVMIYQATHLVNFAQGEMAMFTTYIAWSLVNAGVPYWLAFAATVLLAFLFGVLIERLVIRPVEPILRRDRTEVGEEGERLLRFLHPDASVHRVRLE